MFAKIVNDKEVMFGAGLDDPFFNICFAKRSIIEFPWSLGFHRNMLRNQAYSFAHQRSGHVFSENHIMNEDPVIA